MFCKPEDGRTELGQESTGKILCLDWPAIVDVYLYKTKWNSWMNMLNW